MKKYTLFGIGTILLFFVIYNYLDSKNIQKVQQTSSSVAVEKIVERDVTTPSQQKIVKKLQKPTKEKGTPISKSIANPQEKHLYTTLSIEEAMLSVKPRLHIRPMSAIKLDNRVINTLQAEDKLILNDIAGLDYTLTITHTQQNDDGSVSITGKYTDEGVSYTSTITHSQESTYITLATAQGLYEIESQKNIGYVYDSKAIRKQLQTSYKNDVIIRPIPKAPPTQ